MEAAVETVYGSVVHEPLRAGAGASGATSVPRAILAGFAAIHLLDLVVFYCELAVVMVEVLWCGGGGPARCGGGRCSRRGR